MKDLNSLSCTTYWRHDEICGSSVPVTKSICIPIAGWLLIPCYLRSEEIRADVLYVGRLKLVGNGTHTVYAWRYKYKVESRVILHLRKHGLRDAAPV